MTRIGYDSTNPFDIPTTAQVVFGYCNGIYVWSTAGWARFPTTTKIRISISASINDGHVLDVENGDATPSQAPGWAVMRRLAGINPCIYVNRSNWSAVQSAFTVSGIPQPWYWVATLDGSQIPLTGQVIACQYANSTLAGGHYDLSTVIDLWPGVDTTHGGSGGLIEEDMLYTGPVHPFTASLKAYAAGSYYPEPFANNPAGGVTVGAVYAVDGYCYSNSPVQATVPVESDYVWWHVKTGGWVSDAVLNTVGIAGAPGAAWPATEPVVSLFDPATSKTIPISGGQGPIGPQGPQGIAGPPGAIGPEGPAGPAGQSFLSWLQQILGITPKV